MLKQLKKRFEELEKEALAIENMQRSRNGEAEFIDSLKYLKWETKVRSLLASTCGEDSQYFLRFSHHGNKKTPYDDNIVLFNRQKGVFLAAKEDFDNGHLTSTIKGLIQAEVFDSELEQAEELLKAKYITASAVVAGVVLETAMRDLCNKEGISNGSLEKMNSELAKAAVYNKNQQKQVTALAAIRNSAAHGKINEFTAQDVDSMIRDLRGFLLKYLE